MLVELMCRCASYSSSNAHKLMKAIQTKLLLPLAGALLLMSSCSNDKVDEFFKKFIQAPPSEIERDVKGHDQIYAVHAILRMGYKGGTIGVGPNASEEGETYNTYHVAGDETIIPIVQEIDIAKDDNGQMTITTKRDHFDVIASDKIYYGLELKYYDQNGMLINHQFSNFPFVKRKDGTVEPDEDNSALMMHQHFFGVGHFTLSKGAKDTQKTLQLAYPRTLEETPHYIDRYTFLDRGGKVEPATKFSASNIYVPEGFQLGSNSAVFDNERSWRSIEITVHQTASPTDSCAVSTCSVSISSSPRSSPTSTEIPTPWRRSWVSSSKSRTTTTISTQRPTAHDSATARPSAY